MNNKICQDAKKTGQREPTGQKMGEKSSSFLYLQIRRVEVSIDMGRQYANKYIYYFAAESKKMILKDGRDVHKIRPKDAYDDFENSGVAKLNDQGKVNVVISMPINYHGEEENDKTYKPHIHWKIEGLNNTWSDRNYTLQL